MFQRSTLSITVTFALSLITTSSLMAAPLGSASATPPSKSTPPSSDTRQVLKGYVTPSLSMDTESSDQRLDITFSLDKTRCQAAYGQAWESECARLLQGLNASVTAPKIRPSVAGHWFWRDEQTLSFVPNEGWPLSSSLTISELGKTLPDFIESDLSSVTLLTPPLFAQAINTERFTGPKFDSERGYNVRVKLSRALRQDQFEALRKLVKVEGSGQEALGKISITTNHRHDELLIRVPLVSYPEKNATVTLNVLNLPLSVTTEKTTDGLFVRGSANPTSVSLLIPSKAEVLSWINGSLKTVRNHQLDLRYELDLETPLLVDTERLGKALEVWALPEKINDSSLVEAQWSLLPAVTPELLARSKRLDVIPKNRDKLTTSHRFELNAKPGTFIVYRVKDNVPLLEDVSLQKIPTGILQIPENPASLEFLQPGNMLTTSGERALTLVSTGGERLRWRVEQVRDPFYALFSTEKPDWEKSALTSTLDPTLPTLTVAKEGTIELPKDRPSTDASFIALKLNDLTGAKHLGGLYQVRIELQKYQPALNDFTTVDSVNKRILVTDLAVIHKEGADQTHQVFVASLKTEKPVVNAKVTLLGANGLPLMSAITDANGVATLPSTRGLLREKTPTAFIVDDPQTHDQAWLSVLNSQNLIRPDNTRGALVAPEDLIALGFTDRELYIPGETLHLSALIERADFKNLPGELPITFKLYNPEGTAIFEKTLPLGKNRLLTTEWTSSVSSLVGPYTFDVLAGENVLASRQIQLQSFAPETSTLLTTIPTLSSGWVNSPRVEIQTQVLQNFGAAAPGTLVKLEAEVMPLTTFTHPKWPHFSFENPQVKGNQHSNAVKLPLEPLTTKADGKADTVIDPRSLPGVSSVVLYSEAIDPQGGEPTRSMKRFKVNTLEKVAGYSVWNQGVELHYVPQKHPLFLTLALVNQTFAPRGHERLRVEFQKTEPVTEVFTDSQGIYQYRETLSTRLLDTLELETQTNGESQVALPTLDPGSYQCVVKDAQGSTLLTVPYQVVGQGLDQTHGQFAPSFMRLNTERTHYETGESIAAEVVSPFAGFALVTLENRDVIESHWFPIVEGYNTLKLNVPEKAQGRTWLNVSLIRSLKESERFIPAFQNQVVPLELNMKARDMGLHLTSEQKRTEPNRVSLTLTSDYDGEAILWGVDEGVLALTNTATPDPQTRFLKDRALGVKSRETLSLLMPEGFKLPKTPIYGGDRIMALMANAKGLNPFRQPGLNTAVWWGGRVSLKKGEPTTLEAHFPLEFFGKVRFMAVGANAERIGSAEYHQSMTQPVMLMKHAPSFVAPGDTFTGGVTVQVDEPFKGTITMNPGTGFVVSDFDATSRLYRPNEPVTLKAHFKVKNDPFGKPLSLTVAGELSDATPFKRTETMSMAIRPAVYPEYLSAWYSVNGKSVIHDSALFTPYPTPQAQTTYSISKTPAPLIRSALLTLDAMRSYRPSEKIDRALAWVHFYREPSLFGLTLLTTEAVKAHTLNALSEAFANLDEYRFGHLAQTNESELLVLTRTLNLLRETEAAGLPGVNPQWISPLMKAIQDALNAPIRNLEDARTAAYALWSLTNAGEVTTDGLERLIKVLPSLTPNYQQDPLTSFIAMSYALLGDTDSAERWKNLPKDREKIYPFVKRPRGLTPLEALLVSPELSNPTTPADQLYKELDQISLNALPSRTLASLVIGLTQLSTRSSTPMTQNIQFTCDAWASGFKDTITVKRLPLGTVATLTGCKAVTITSDQPMNGLYASEFASGYPYQDQQKAVNRGISVQKTLLTLEGKPVTTVHVGDKIQVRLNVKDLSEAGDRVRVEDLFPAGFVWTEKGSSTTIKGPVDQAVHSDDSVSFLSQSSRSPMVFTYTLQATVPGTFTVPAVQVTNDASPQYMGRNAAQTINVLPPSKEDSSAHRDVKPSAGS